MQFQSLRFAYLVLLLCAACSEAPDDQLSPESPATFAGSASCKLCHARQFDAWQGSHHQLAMQIADEDSVLGDFSSAEFTYFGRTTRFYSKDGEFFVRTANARGDSEEFQVTHTFGVDPLQQYLVKFPGGRKQVLPVAWDTRPESEGGHRWFHLYPDDDVAPGDWLHWTGRYSNWNYMCAECHSTNVELGYDLDSNSFSTTYAEVSVGCEACHGPGSRHISQAHDGRFETGHGLSVNLDDRASSSWIMNTETGIAERSRPATRQQQPENCGRCHARRSNLVSEYRYGKPLPDTHMPALLEENLYFPDGRMKDEVYVYGSFLQSKMYRAGVTCSDCHNPHSTELVTGGNVNNVCAQCHLTTKFATEDHSVDVKGDCVSCHMPARTYMGIDDRRDHSFRIPGAGEMPEHYGKAIAAGRQGSANDTILEALANRDHPAIARATLLTLLTPAGTEGEAASVSEGLDDPDPLVRIAALRYVRNAPPEERTEKGSRLLSDPILGVRVEAAQAYADIRDLLPVEDARAFRLAAEEYRESLRQGLSMPETATVLAAFESRLGNDAASNAYLQHALRLDPELAAARYAYGLLLVRMQRSDDALVELRTAVELEPGNSHYTYTYAIALHSLGRTDEALDKLAHAWIEFPGSFDIGWALATILRDAGERQRARSIAAELAEQFPDDRRARGLLESLSEGH